MAIEELIQILQDIAGRYGLKILYLDYSDITLISRVGFSPDIFIQIYANIKKEKNKYGADCWRSENLWDR